MSQPLPSRAKAIELADDVFGTLGVVRGHALRRAARVQRPPAPSDASRCETAANPSDAGKQGAERKLRASVASHLLAHSCGCRART
jgi:hypothetical protein